jgi:exodeoxyribonuclease-5
MRKMRGFDDPLPMKGEKLVCLRNNHQLGLLNGQIWNVISSASKANLVRLHLQDEDGTLVTCLAHPDHFRGTEIDVANVRSANELDFGYALTVHKAQGSQWDHVALVDEWQFKDREKWLYTGITRAAEKVTVLA